MPSCAGFTYRLRAEQAPRSPPANGSASVGAEAAAPRLSLPPPQQASAGAASPQILERGDSTDRPKKDAAREAEMRTPRAKGWRCKEQFWGPRQDLLFGDQKQWTRGASEPARTSATPLAQIRRVRIVR